MFMLQGNNNLKKTGAPLRQRAGPTAAAGRGRTYHGDCLALGHGHARIVHFPHVVWVSHQNGTTHCLGHFVKRHAGPIHTGVLLYPEQHKHALVSEVMH